MDTFNLFYKRLLKIKFRGTSGVMMPRGSALKRAVKEASPFLPDSYIDKYATPLECRLPRLIKLASAKRLDQGTLETITGVIYQHRQGSLPAAPLSRLLAVISNFYRSFLADEKRIPIRVNLSTVLPPLAMFQHDGGLGPFTFTVEDLNRLMGAEISVVSLPAVYAKHPILWAALAHEVSGHDVTHADPGLLEELASAVSGAFAGVPTPHKVSREQMNLLWSYWIDEATADVYGLLNIGPALTVSQAAFHAALSADGPRAQAKLRMESGFDTDDPMYILDDHPTDILRLHLAIGVIDTLSRLSPKTRSTYTKLLETLARALSTGKTIRIEGNIFLERDHIQHISLTAPLSFMQQIARNVGALIASATLSALAGHSIQNIETWDDSDETQSMIVKTALLQGKKIALLGDDAQLLAGSVMALLEKPALYDSITAALNAGLDLSFQRDPIWGKPQARQVTVRY